MYKHKLVDFIIQFMEEVDKEISEMKLSLNSRARIVSESYLSQVQLLIPVVIFKFISTDASNAREQSICVVTKRHFSVSLFCPTVQLKLLISEKQQPCRRGRGHTDWQQRKETVFVHQPNTATTTGIMLQIP